ncbi:hypothetical protein [Motilibacter deserti]|uniref:DUF8129 domain-containing protein n=1 Tax=Motilibacter deserti TaxID=2714956 RepID=A0ABX0GQU9_9ACTN|nr:hypothetical protein [Motilibacter deserti]NHC13228.1 hypothetical protein [Motilibacter deserti]
MAEPNEQAVPAHSELPLPDYDHLPAGTLQHRIRTLDLPSLEQLIAYEEAHAGRLLVLNVMRQRREELAAGAEPSGGDPLAATPEAPPAPASGSPVSGATTGPVQNPTTGGDPTNPGQPRGSGHGSTQSRPYGT